MVGRSLGTIRDEDDVRGETRASWLYTYPDLRMLESWHSQGGAVRST